MAEPKPFASLTSGLLARKGAAMPAMRRQAMLGAGVHSQPFDSIQGHDDLGWNDMGEDHGRTAEAPASIGLTPMAGGALPVAPSPVVSGAVTPSPIVENMPVAEAMPLPPVVEQRRALAEKVEQPASAVEAVIEPVPAALVKAPAPVAIGARSKAAFTLRLDPERHLRLRLACAVANRSAQQIVTEALDAFLDSQPQIEALADQLPRPSGQMM